MLGRFHEISVAAPDIRASIEFYESLGFTQAATGDAWAHPYAVLTDGRVAVGLHQDPHWPSSLTFVRGQIAEHAAELERFGLELRFANTQPDRFNEIGLSDPGGQLVRLVEARTYSPVARRPQDTSLCGHFAQFSMPATDPELAKSFWEPLGFVATAECLEPYPHLPLTSDHLDVAFHAPRMLARPALAFFDETMSARIAQLRARGVPEARGLPRTLNPATCALLEAPEGTLLLLAGMS